MEHETKCANPECSSVKVFAQGLCSGCYSRRRRRGTVERKNVSNKGACSIQGCDRQAFAKNLCAKHYQSALHPLRMIWRNLRSRSPGQYPASWDRFEGFIADVGERPTDKHQLRRPDHTVHWGPENFVWRPPIGFSAATPEYGRAWNLRKKYGLTEDDVTEMEAAQGGLCAICRTPETAGDRNGNVRRLGVDHSHITGRVRGLLCSRCNSMIGEFGARDNPDVLRAAAAYLEENDDVLPD